jgi:PAS domain S-box-containing protein
VAQGSLSSSQTLDEARVRLESAVDTARALIRPLPAAGAIVADDRLRIALIEGDVFSRLGWDTENHGGRHLSDVLAADAWNRLRGSYEAALAGRRQSFRTHADQGDRDYAVEMSPVGDPVAGVVVVVQDVTADREQRARDRRMTTALNSLTDGVVIVGMDGRIVDLNPAAGEILERREEQLVDANWWSHLEPRDGRGRPLSPDHSPIADVLASGRARSGVELTLKTGSGDRRTVMADYQPLMSADDRVEGVVVLVRDVSVERALQARERALLEQVDRVFEGSPTGMALMRPGGDFQRVNPAMCKLLGRPAEEALGLNWRDVIHPDDVGGTVEQVQRMYRGEETTLMGPRRYVRADGAIVPVLVSVTAVPDPAGQIGGFFCEFHDLSAVVHAQRARSLVVESALDAIVTIDERGHITEFNPAAELMFGRSRVDVMGIDVAAVIIPPDHRHAHRKALRGLAQGAEPRMLGRRIELKAQRADGSLFPIELTITRMPTEPAGYIAFIRDLSDARSAESLLASTIAGLGEGVIVADADDRLVLINAAGERLTGWRQEELGGRLLHETFHRRREDGSEYPVEECIVRAVRSRGEALHFHEDVFTRRDGTTFPVSLSVSPVGTADGRGAVVVSFRDITEEQAEERRLRADLDRMETVTAIYEALENDRFRLYAQPIFDLATGALVSEELLLRMLGRDGELIAPGEFLPVAETHEVMVEIDRWVIGGAAALAADGRRVAVNLSARSVGTEEVLGTIEQALDATGADPRRLTFEITETAVAEDLAAAGAFAQRLASLGCGFALDDFGTGYGTLTYLKSLPASYIKIDQSFVRDLMASDASRKVVEVIVGTAATFGLTTIAEGVEDDDTRDLLRELGVDWAQGFLLGRPHPA